MTTTTTTTTTEIQWTIVSLKKGARYARPIAGAPVGSWRDAVDAAADTHRDDEDFQVWYVPSQGQDTKDGDQILVGSGRRERWVPIRWDAEPQLAYRAPVEAAEPVTVTVAPIKRLPGEWFATIRQGQGQWNNPGASAANAVLNSWTAWTEYRQNVAAMLVPGARWFPGRPQARPVAEAPVRRVTWEATTCDRCGGTGRMPFAAYGGVCFKCNQSGRGNGQVLTNAGRAAHKAFVEARAAACPRVPAAELQPGQRFSTDGGHTWRTVTVSPDLGLAPQAWAGTGDARVPLLEIETQRTTVLVRRDEEVLVRTPEAFAAGVARVQGMRGAILER